jgi:cytochrome c-type biogenesis protein CcmE
MDGLARTPDLTLRYWPAMDPARRRTVRFVVALSAAVLLSGALVWTSFSASTEARSPSQLLAAAKPGKTYELTGKVVPGYEISDGVLTFKVRDREGNTSVPVTYRGQIPDPFRADREVIIDVRKEGSTFVGEKDSLITKCPSKFTAEKPKS